MTGQLALHGLTPTPNLTPGQQALYDLVRQTGGLSSLDAGRHVHARRGHHPVSETCPYCEEAGSQALRGKNLRPLIVRRRTGQWEPRQPEPVRGTVGLSRRVGDDPFEGL